MRFSNENKNNLNLVLKINSIIKFVSIIALLFKPKSHKIDRSSMVWPSHWKEFEVIATGIVPLSLLEINIIGMGFVEVNETPHYKYLTSEYKSLLYVDYMKRNYKLQNTDEQLAIFKRLHNELRLNPQNIEVLVRPRFFFSKKYKVIDGAHRLAILASFGLDQVRVKISF